MLDNLITIDDQTDDTDYHKIIRTKIKEPNHTGGDRDFTPTEVKNAIEDLKNKKALGEDGIARVLYLRVYKLFPTLTYTIYGECLRTGCFPKRWEKSK
jgi:hypothetical protein